MLDEKAQDSYRSTDKILYVLYVNTYILYENAVRNKCETKNCGKIVCIRNYRRRKFTERKIVLTRCLPRVSNL